MHHCEQCTLHALHQQWTLCQQCTTCTTSYELHLSCMRASVSNVQLTQLCTFLQRVSHTHVSHVQSIQLRTCYASATHNASHSADSAQALRLTHQLRSLKSSTQQPCPRSARCGSMTSWRQQATLRLASTRHQVTNQSGACTTTD